MKNILIGMYLVIMLCACDSRTEVTNKVLSLGEITSIEQAQDTLSKQHGFKVHNYSTFDFGREKDRDNISIIVPEEYARKNIITIQAALSNNLVAFIGTTRWLGDETHKGVEIVIANVSNKFDVLNKSRSDAINYGMETQDLIYKLSKFEDQLNINIFHAETDTIEFTYKNNPSSYSELAQSLYEFCPDIVNQGAGSLENLVEHLKQQKTIYLWWD